MKIALIVLLYKLDGKLVTLLGHFETCKMCSKASVFYACFTGVSCAQHLESAEQCAAL